MVARRQKSKQNSRGTTRKASRSRAGRGSNSARPQKSTPVDRNGRKDDLSVFLAAQAHAASALASRAGAGYLEALGVYWNGDPTQALDLASGILAEEPNHPFRFSLYRLWIEILASAGESLSLTGLRDHLLLVGRDAGADREIFAALRGLIHLELDEIEGASLVARSLHNASANPWVTEFLAAFDQRGSVGFPSTSVRSGLSAWTDSGAVVTDWVQWRQISFAAMHELPDVGFERVLGVLDDVFPGSPLTTELRMRHMFEAGQFHQVRSLAAGLRKRFPASAEYAFFDVAAAANLGDHEAVVALLDRVPGLLSPDQDADLSLIAGQSTAAVAAKRGDARLAKVARNHFDRALHLLEAGGMSTVSAVSGLAKLNAAFPPVAARENVFRPAKAWLIQLSQRRYHELRTSSEANIGELIRSIGDKARAGDLCFFAAPAAPRIEDANGHEARSRGPSERSANWSIGAVYIVATDPAWDPIDGCVSVLDLITRPGDPVQVDMSELAQTEAPSARDASTGRTAPSRNRNHPSRHAAFELSDRAIDVITNAVRQRNAGDAMRIERRSTDRNRMTKSS